MTKATQDIILAMFDLADLEFPDKSLEFVVQIVADRVGCNSQDVYEALAKEHGK